MGNLKKPRQNATIAGMHQSHPATPHLCLVPTCGHCQVTFPPASLPTRTKNKPTQGAAVCEITTRIISPVPPRAPLKPPGSRFCAPIAAPAHRPAPLRGRSRRDARERRAGAAPFPPDPPEMPAPITTTSYLWAMALSPLSPLSLCRPRPRQRLRSDPALRQRRPARPGPAPRRGLTDYPPMGAVRGRGITWTRPR